MKSFILLTLMYVLCDQQADVKYYNYAQSQADSRVRYIAFDN